VEHIVGSGDVDQSLAAFPPRNGSLRRRNRLVTRGKPERVKAANLLKEHWPRWSQAQELRTE